jgi:hypothetical protein
MRMLRGIHTQPSTGRQFNYWVAYESIGNIEAIYYGALSEPSRGMFGGLERGKTFDGTIPIGPDFAPIELRIRARVLGHIERTDFGERKPPPPSWIGWYGPYL